MEEQIIEKVVDEKKLNIINKHQHLLFDILMLAVIFWLTTKLLETKQQQITDRDKLIEQKDKLLNDILMAKEKTEEMKAIREELRTQLTHPTKKTN